jgi:hypothetical protein
MRIFDNSYPEWIKLPGATVFYHVSRWGATAGHIHGMPAPADWAAAI